MLLGTIPYNPPIIAGLAEYLMTDGVSGWVPLLAGVCGACIVLFVPFIRDPIVQVFKND